MGDPKSPDRSAPRTKKNLEVKPKMDNVRPSVTEVQKKKKLNWDEDESQRVTNN